MAEGEGPQQKRLQCARRAAGSKDLVNRFGPEGVTKGPLLDVIL